MKPAAIGAAGFIFLDLFTGNPALKRPPSW
jgi:hypothetical protein